MRIDHAPLPRPVLANAFVSVNSAAFHAVGPFDIGSHRCQRAFDVAGIECGVGLFHESNSALCSRLCHRNYASTRNFPSRMICWSSTQI